jgi:hypothetical protein
MGKFYKFLMNARPEYPYCFYGVSASFDKEGMCLTRCSPCLELDNNSVEAIISLVPIMDIVGAKA